MNIINNKLKYCSLALTLCALAFVIVMAMHSYNRKDVQSGQNGIILRDFVSGSQVKYKIVENGSVIEENTKTFADNEVVSLPAPPGLEAAADRDVTYELSISNPASLFSLKNEADVLEMILNLNIKDLEKNVSLHAKGLNEFADVKVSKGDKTEKLSADWAGLLSADINDFDNQTISPEEDIIELAFQNAGIDGDFNAIGNGKVDVIFQEIFPSQGGSSLQAVQARYSRALRMMTTELSAVMVMQTQIIGTFFDAGIQLDTQRKHQELLARAHKDYHPSEALCRIGTFMRNVATSDSRSEINKYALNKMLINQYTAVQNSSAAGGPSVSGKGILNQYSDDFCDPFDNNSATAVICPVASGTIPAVEVDRRNKDIDYTRTLLNKLTLDIDFGGAGADTLTNDEEDIIALAKNLYFPNVFDADIKNYLNKDPRSHFDTRSFAAKMNVAHTSFVNIVGMKSSAPIAPDGAAQTLITPVAPSSTSHGSGQASPPHYEGSGVVEDSGARYMKSMLREFGIPDTEIQQYLGERPSYYAQMEVLTKKIYQHPNFYTNLYDKPANVDRIGASIDAITLMNQRDRYESLLRREMLTSVLVEEALVEPVEAITSNIYEQINTSQALQ